MQIPSLILVRDRAFETVLRFPATLLAAIVGTIATIIEIGGEHQPNMTELERLACVCALGLPLFFAIELWLERRGDRLGEDYSRNKRASMRGIMYVAVVVALGIVYSFLDNTGKNISRLVLFILAAHLLVAYLPFLRDRETNAFWQFNKTIFLRILISGLYTGVLQIGLSLALLALDKLFGADIHRDAYPKLFAFLLGIFNTWFFLAGVPRNLHALGDRTDYPKGLKVFTQFVLLPLVTIYLCILYPYAAKLLFNWELPRGWVSNPVLCFSVAGILSFLLLHPIRNEEGNGWIRGFAKYFFVALVPLLTLPTLGILRRINDYGVTESRYFVIVLTAWLLGLALYFIISRRKDIRAIPLTLSIVAILSAVGPTSAFAVSLRSQLSRLERLLNEHKVIGRSRDMKQKVPIRDREAMRIHSIINYVNSTHGEDVMADWLRERLPVGALPRDADLDRDVNQALGVQMVNRHDRPVRRLNLEAYRTHQGVIISGYDYFMPAYFDRYAGNGLDTTLTIKGRPVRIHLQSEMQHLTVSSGSVDSIRLTFEAIIDELTEKQSSRFRIQDSLGMDRNTVLRETENLRILIAFRQADVAMEGDTIQHFHGNGSLFIGVK